MTSEFETEIDRLRARVKELETEVARRDYLVRANEVLTGKLRAISGALSSVDALILAVQKGERARVDVIRDNIRRFMDVGTEHGQVTADMLRDAAANREWQVKMDEAAKVAKAVDEAVNVAKAAHEANIATLIQSRQLAINYHEKRAVVYRNRWLYAKSYIGALKIVLARLIDEAHGYDHALATEVRRVCRRALADPYGTVSMRRHQRSGTRVPLADGP